MSNVLPLPAHSQSAARAAARHAAAGIREDAPIYAGLAIYVAAAVFFLSFAGALDRADFGLYLKRWSLPLLIGFPLLVAMTGAALAVMRTERRRILAFRAMMTPRRAGQIMAGTALLLALALFQGTFTSVKNGLSVWRGGFPHDRLQADLDKVLHFGVEPWQFLPMPRTGSFLHGLIEWNYGGLWFVLCFGALMIATMARQDRALRLRYVGCFMLVWIVVGNMFAGLFMSAGPAFYGLVTGDPARFAEQLALLSGAGSRSALYQSYLWSLHETGQTGFASGISAFPSVHVGLAAMNAMFAWSIDRRLGIAAWLYTAFVQASSVYLAWHYAIDGYAAIAIVALVYLAMKRLTPSATRELRR